MTTPSDSPPFERRETVDKPGIVGARWWQEAVSKPVPRRQILLGLLAAGGLVASGIAMVKCASSPSSTSGSSEPPEGVAFQPRTALDMQKEYGWDFGARGEPLVFDGQSTQAFDR